MWKLVLLIWTTIQSVTGLNEYDEYSPKGAHKIPVILMHKQALSHEGDFNFAFASDNGLKQGEKIHPDGSRTGAYSYVDPNGKTISVKYSAGKDGFKILEGDHVPKAIQAVSPSHNHNYQASAEEFSRPAAPFVSPRPSFPFASSSNLESGEHFYNPRPSPSHSNNFRQHNPLPRLPYRIYEDSSQEIVPPSTNLREQQEPEQHQGPHSFGSGYAFEFSAASKNSK